MGHDGLIDSFLSPLHNHRADEYGGPARNRLRLAREVLLRRPQSCSASSSR